MRLRFDASIASAVKERTWHPSQQMKDRPDGSVVMTLEVCDDYALRSWILGFGRYVHVLAPSSLVDWALDELDAAREQYVSAAGSTTIDSSIQPPLPFPFGRLANA